MSEMSLSERFKNENNVVESVCGDAAAQIIMMPMTSGEVGYADELQKPNP